MTEPHTLYVFGTGNATMTRYYNTCFAIRRFVNFHTFLQIVSFFTIITLIIVLVYTFCRPDQLISYIK